MCDFDSAMHDSRSVFLKRKGKPNRIAMMKFAQHNYWDARHFCNDGYVDGRFNAVISQVDFEAVRDTAWALKDILVNNQETTSVNANMRCFVTSDIYLFGFFLRRHGNEKPIEQSMVLSPEDKEDKNKEWDLKKLLVSGVKKSHVEKGKKGLKLGAGVGLEIVDRITPFGSLSLQQGNFGILIDVSNISNYIKLDLPPSIKEFRIFYPGAKFLIGAGAGAPSNW